MGMSICFYVERWTGTAWEHVPGVAHGRATDVEFAWIGRGRSVYAALAGDPGMAPVGMKAGGDPPPDASPEVAAELLALEDMHCGIGWHALAELLAYDWKANQAASDDIMGAIDRMKAVGPPDAVRCVFAFVH